MIGAAHSRLRLPWQAGSATGPLPRGRQAEMICARVLPEALGTARRNPGRHAVLRAMTYCGAFSVASTRWRRRPAAF